MKKILNMSLIIILLMQCNNIFSSQPTEQGWLDKAKNWAQSWFQAIPAKAKIAGAVTGYGYATKATPELAKSIGNIALEKGLGIDWWRDMKPTPESWHHYETAALGLGTVAIMGFFIGFFDWVDKASNSADFYKNIDSTKESISSSLTALLSNRQLYPTFQSGLHALSTKEDFVNLAYSKHYLFEAVCNEIMAGQIDWRNKLNTELKEENWDQPYYFAKTKEEWKQYLAKEKEIDNYIVDFRKSIQHLPLEGQIRTLEQLPLNMDKDNNTYLNYTSQMAAFESVYGRLKLKLEISRMLVGGEKSKLDPFGLEAVKKMTPEERKKREEELKNWKKTAAGKAWKVKAEKRIAAEKEILQQIEQEREKTFKGYQAAKEKYLKETERVKANIERAKAREEAKA